MCHSSMYLIGSGSLKFIISAIQLNFQEHRIFCISSLIFWFSLLKVNEHFPFNIALSWKGAASDSQNGAVDNQQSTVVFPKGNPIPSVKALTFYRSGTFSVDVHYTDSDQQAKISTYTVRVKLQYLSSLSIFCYVMEIKLLVMCISRSVRFNLLKVEDQR